MKTNKLEFLLMTIFLITLASCDPGVQYNKILNNKSDYDLKLYIYHQYVRGNLYKNDSFVINKHTELSIYEYNSIGQTSDYEDCESFSDSIIARIIGNDTLHLTINLSDKSNWFFSVLEAKGGGGGKCECRITITNENIK